MLPIIKKVLLTLKNDKRSLVLLLVAPLFISVILYGVFNSAATINTTYTIAFQDAPSAIVDEFNNVDHVDTYITNDYETVLANHTVDAAVIFENQKDIKIVFYDANPFTNMQIQSLITDTLANTSQEITTEFYYGSSSDNYYSDFAYVVITFVSLFLIFIISGMTFVKEKSLGTIKRMLATKITRRKVTFGFIIGFSIFAILQSLFLIAFNGWFLGVDFGENLGLVLLIQCFIAISSIVLGQFVSTFSNNEFQVMQMIPLLIIPQLVFCGIIPLETMPNWISWIAYICPLYYGAQAMNLAINFNATLVDVLPYLMGLVIISTVLITLNIRLLKKYTTL